jgi:hypothetical protein
MPRVFMKVEGMTLVLGRLEGSWLLGHPWRDAMTKVLKVLRGEVEKNVPRATGRLAGSIEDRLSPKPVPMWGIVTARAESSNGVRYPFVLQAGHREHTRTSPARRKGRNLKQARAAGLHTKGMVGGEILLHYRNTTRSTRGWITKGLRQARAEMTSILETAAREIERRWIG